MGGLWRGLGGWRYQGIGPGLKGPSASLLHLSRPLLRQPPEEGPQLLPDLGLSPQTTIGRHFLPRPVPNGLVGVEIRAVGWQGHQLEF